MDKGNGNQRMAGQQNHVQGGFEQAALLKGSKMLPERDHKPDFDQLARLERGHLQVYPRLGIDTAAVLNGDSELQRVEHQEQTEPRDDIPERRDLMVIHQGQDHRAEIADGHGEQHGRKVAFSAVGVWRHRPKQQQAVCGNRQHQKPV